MNSAIGSGGGCCVVREREQDETMVRRAMTRTVRVSRSIIVGTPRGQNVVKRTLGPYILITYVKIFATRKKPPRVAWALGGGKVGILTPFHLSSYREGGSRWAVGGAAAWPMLVVTSGADAASGKLAEVERRLVRGSFFPPAERGGGGYAILNSTQPSVRLSMGTSLFGRGFSAHLSPVVWCDER